MRVRSVASFASFSSICGLQALFQQEGISAFVACRKDVGSFAEFDSLLKKGGQRERRGQRGAWNLRGKRFLSS